MPYHSMSEEDRDQIWDDGLHLTPYGYSVMGGHIAKRLVELLEEILDLKVEGDTSDKADHDKNRAKGRTEKK